MADLIKKIRTAKGDLQIDYNALANLPTISYTVDENGVLRLKFGSSAPAGRYTHTITIDYLAYEDLSDIRYGYIVIKNDDPTDYSGDYSNMPMDIAGNTLKWGTEIYTIQSYDGCKFIMTDGTELIYESPGELCDTVTDTSGNSIPLIISGIAYPVTAGMTWGEFVSQHPNSFYLYADESFTGASDIQMVFFAHNNYPVVVDYDGPNGGQICLENDIIDTSVAYVEY